MSRITVLSFPVLPGLAGPAGPAGPQGPAGTGGGFSLRDVGSFSEVNMPGTRFGYVYSIPAGNDGHPLNGDITFADGGGGSVLNTLTNGATPDPAEVTLWDNVEDDTQSTFVVNTSGLYVVKVRNFSVNLPPAAGVYLSFDQWYGDAVISPGFFFPSEAAFDEKYMTLPLYAGSVWDASWAIRGITNEDIADDLGQINVDFAFYRYA